MTSIGYGEITPREFGGRVIIIIFIVILALMFTIYLSEIIDLMSKRE